MARLNEFEMTVKKKAALSGAQAVSVASWYHKSDMNVASEN